MATGDFEVLKVAEGMVIGVMTVKGQPKGSAVLVVNRPDIGQGLEFSDEVTVFSRDEGLASVGEDTLVFASALVKDGAQTMG